MKRKNTFYYLFAKLDSASVFAERKAKFTRRTGDFVENRECHGETGWLERSVTRPRGTTKTVPKPFKNEKKHHALHKVSKIHLFYYLYCVFGRSSFKKDCHVRISKVQLFNLKNTILMVNSVKSDQWKSRMNDVILRCLNWPPAI